MVWRVQLRVLPSGPLTTDEYILERLDDQIDNFYRPRAREYEAVVRRARAVTLVLGIAATLLGLFSATEWGAGWVAVVTTAIASIASYLFAGRYQSQLISYQSTAAQLDALRSEWRVLAMQNPTPEQRAEFVKACEEAISIENSAWMSRWLEKPPGESVGAATGDS